MSFILYTDEFHFSDEIYGASCTPMGFCHLTEIDPKQEIYFILVSFLSRINIMTCNVTPQIMLSFSKMKTAVMPIKLFKFEFTSIC